MLNIVLFGPPGAGKGTQSEKLITKYKLTHISTGDLLRAEIKNQTELGIAAKKFIDNGALVPDEVVIGMIKNKLAADAGASGFIFDGFPRTVEQAKALDVVLQDMGTSITLMVALDVDNEELIRRLVERGKTSGRTDDNEETIRKRIAVYNEETSPVAGFYAEQGKLFKVNGIGTIGGIFDNICTVIDNASVSNS